MALDASAFRRMVGCVCVVRIWNLRYDLYLGLAADWQPVYTCPPAPVLTNSWTIPIEFSTNSFFRVR